MWLNRNPMINSRYLYMPHMDRIFVIIINHFESKYKSSEINLKKIAYKFVGRKLDI